MLIPSGMNNLNNHVSLAAGAVNRFMGSFMDEFFGGRPVAEYVGQRGAALNVWEDANALHIEAEIPGFAMNDIQLELVGRKLTLKGETATEPEPETTGKWLIRERSAKAFHRQLTLPVDVDSQAVSARLENGILTVTLPKAEAAKARKIEIKSVR